MRAYLYARWGHLLFALSKAGGGWSMLVFCFSSMNLAVKLKPFTGREPWSTPFLYPYSWFSLSAHFSAKKPRKKRLNKWVRSTENTQMPAVPSVFAREQWRLGSHVGNPGRTADKQITSCNAPLSPANDDIPMNNATWATVNGKWIRREGIYNVCGDKHDNSEINAVASMAL